MMNFNLSRKVLEYDEALENMQREADQWKPTMPDIEDMEFSDEEESAKQFDIDTIILQYKENLEETKAHNEQISNLISKLKMEKAKRNRDPEFEIFRFKD